MNYYKTHIKIMSNNLQLKKPDSWTAPTLEEQCNKYIIWFKILSQRDPTPLEIFIHAHAVGFGDAAIFFENNAK